MLIIFIFFLLFFFFSPQLKTILKNNNIGLILHYQHFYSLQLQFSFCFVVFCCVIYPDCVGGSSMPNTPLHQERVENTSSTLPPPTTSSAHSPLQTLPDKSKVQTLTNLPEHIIKQGKYIIKDGKKILVLPPQAMQQYKDSLKQQEQQPQQQQQQIPPQQSAQMANLPEPLPLSPLGGGVADDKFELTDDYIQQTIKEALQASNLAPEIGWCKR